MCYSTTCVKQAMVYTRRQESQQGLIAQPMTHDPEVQNALQRRAQIFHMMQALQAKQPVVTVDTLVTAMDQAGKFKPQDYVWVRTTLAKRLSSV